MVGNGVDAQDLPDYAENNDAGTARLLAAMSRADVRDLVLASSMVVYGDGRYTCPVDGDVPPAVRREDDLAAGRFDPRCPACGSEITWREIGEDTPFLPRTSYAASKVAQEHYAGAWCTLDEARTIALRYHNVYGPGMPRDTPYAGVAAIFRSALERGEAPEVFEDGGQRRDFIHVDDIAAANLHAIEWTADAAPATARPFNVGSGTVSTILEVAQQLSRAHGGPEPVITGRFRAGDVRHITASSARARAELGWAPTVHLADGMREFAAAPLRA
jgi:dTDP-L-rhamnose 4-epimerase